MLTFALGCILFLAAGLFLTLHIGRSRCGMVTGLLLEYFVNETFFICQIDFLDTDGFGGFLQSLIIHPVEFVKIIHILYVKLRA